MILQEQLYIKGKAKLEAYGCKLILDSFKLIYF